MSQLKCVNQGTSVPILDSLEQQQELLTAHLTMIVALYR
jgi:hypothetical protein